MAVTWFETCGVAALSTMRETLDPAWAAAGTMRGPVISSAREEPALWRSAMSALQKP